MRDSLSLPGILRDRSIHKTWSMASFDAIPTLPDGHERKWLSFSFFETSKRRKRQRTQIGETLERGRKDAGDAFQHSSRQRGTLKKIEEKKETGQYHHTCHLVVWRRHAVRGSSARLPDNLLVKINESSR